MAKRSGKRWRLRLEELDEFEYDLRVSNHELAAAVAEDIIGDLDREAMIALYLDVKNRPVGYSIVSIGTLDGTLVHPREIFKMAYMVNAKSLIMVHNHPSGHLSISQEDIDVTRRMVDAGEMLGIGILDHVIVVPDGRSISLANEGYL